MKSVKEHVSAIKSMNAEKKKNGKHVVSTFSRREFNNIMQTTLNDVDYESTRCITKDGKMIKETFKPVQEFREKFLMPIFIDCKLDKEDAVEKAKTYEFSRSQAETLYPIVSDVIYNYMDSGKKFNFIPKEDFVASISIKQNKESVTTNTRYNTKTKRKAYRSLVKKSGTPSWLKERI